MAGPISTYLVEDHSRLDALLRQAIARPGGPDPTSYGLFRAGLLRHIGLEEKILLPALRRASGGRLPEVAGQLRRDHAALASLLVPSPATEILDAILRLLAVHNPIEEDPGGLYESCDTLLAPDASAIEGRLRDAPGVPLAPHLDGPRVRRHVESLLREARGWSLGER